MEWQKIDFEKKLWEIPATKMKMKEPHIVPLCNQAIEILQDIYPLTSWGQFVFPNERSRKTPVSDGTVNNNRTSHLPQRIKMMQTWADYLDKLKAGAEILPLRRNSL